MIVLNQSAELWLWQKVKKKILSRLITGCVRHFLVSEAIWNWRWKDLGPLDVVRALKTARMFELQNLQ